MTKVSNKDAWCTFKGFLNVTLYESRLYTKQGTPFTNVFSAMFSPSMSYYHYLTAKTPVYNNLIGYMASFKRHGPAGMVT